MQTIDLGPAFFHFIRVRNAPLLHTALTIETDPPFRKSRSLIARVPLIPRIPVLRDLPLMDRAIVLGWWRHTDWDEETALMQALQGYGMDLYDEDLDDPEVRQVIRENIAAQGLPPDEEWQIVSAFGVVD